MIERLIKAVHDAQAVVQEARDASAAVHDALQGGLEGLKAVIAAEVVGKVDEDVLALLAEREQQLASIQAEHGPLIVRAQALETDLARTQATLDDQTRQVIAQRTALELYRGRLAPLLEGRPGLTKEGTDGTVNLKLTVGEWARLKQLKGT